MGPLAAVGLSVLLHVSWNLLTRRTHCEANFLWWIVGLHGLLVAPFALPAFLHAAQQAPALYLCALLSGTANGVYFVALRHAYQHAPAGVVYPLVRSSPLLIAVVEACWFGRDFSLLAWAAIALAVLGLWFIATSQVEPGQRIGRAWPLALLAALMTVCYSLSDKQAAPHLPQLSVALGYVCMNYLLAWPFLAVDQRLRTGRWLPQRRPSGRALAIGVLGVGSAYALVIHAMRGLPAAHVVALTNAGIVLTVLLGILWLHEHSGWRRRMAGAGMVAAGLGGVVWSAV